MIKSKFLSTVFLLFACVMLTNGVSFAECTHEVNHSDGKVSITTDCSSSRTETKDNFWDFGLQSTMLSNFLSNVSLSMQNLQDKVADIFDAQARSRQVAADAQERQQEAIQSQEVKQQDQESQMEDMKDRQEMQKQQQMDSMQAMSDRR